MTRWRKGFGLGLVGACVALSASVASATVVWDNTEFVVQEIVVSKEGKVWVKLDQNVDTHAEGGGPATSCTGSNEVQIHDDATAATKELMMKVLVAAQLSGRLVSLKVEKPASTCLLHAVSMQ